MRKESGYTLKDLDDLLDGTDEDITLKDGDKVTKDDLSKIKKAKKTVNLNKYDSKGNLLYTIVVNGKELDDTSEFKTDLVFDI